MPAQNLKVVDERIKTLKQQWVERTKEESNPRSLTDLRSLRKRLKRQQRKRRVLQSLENRTTSGKNKNKPTAKTEPSSSEEKPGE